jgi:hypothetical protein
MVFPVPLKCLTNICIIDCGFHVYAHFQIKKNVIPPPLLFFFCGMTVDSPYCEVVDPVFTDSCMQHI